MPGDAPIRVVTRVRDFIGDRLEPSAVVDACSRCGFDVYFTLAQTGIPDGTAAVCTRCIVSDPKLRAGSSPEQLRLMRKGHEIADGGGPVPWLLSKLPRR